MAMLLVRLPGYITTLHLSARLLIFKTPTQKHAVPAKEKLNNNNDLSRLSFLCAHPK